MELTHLCRMSHLTFHAVCISQLSDASSDAGMRVAVNFKKCSVLKILWVRKQHCRATCQKLSGPFVDNNLQLLGQF